MSLVRVFYRTDGGITVRRVNKGMKKKLIAEKIMQSNTDTEFFDICKQLNPKVRPILQGATYEDIEESDLPVYDSATRSKWRKKPGGGVFIDATVITTVEKIQKIEDDIDVELAKPNPDVIAAMRLQRKLDKREYD